MGSVSTSVPSIFMFFYIRFLFYFNFLCCYWLFMALSALNPSVLELWVIAFIQCSRGSFSASERFSVGSNKASNIQPILFNTLRDSDFNSPLESAAYLEKLAVLQKHINDLQIVSTSTINIRKIHKRCIYSSTYTYLKYSAISIFY